MLKYVILLIGRQLDDYKTQTNLAATQAAAADGGQAEGERFKKNFRHQQSLCSFGGHLVLGVLRVCFIQL